MINQAELNGSVLIHKFITLGAIRGFDQRNI